MSDEHVAVRTKAGLMDVSGLKKIHLIGPHAIAILEYITTRDMTKIYPGRSVYACILNDKGLFTDDCIVYRTGPNSWMLVHGSGTAHEEVVKQAVGRNVAVLFDDDPRGRQGDGHYACLLQRARYAARRELSAVLPV
jgi:aminomethyltransferase